MIRLLVVMLLLSLAIASSAKAGVMAASTRVIYQASDREKSLMLVNTNPYPVIVQSWVDTGKGDPLSANAPFVILPAVFRMAPQGIQGLRILFNQETLPADRESAFWLNLYEVPPMGSSVPDAKRVMLAMNTQLKIFYRPKGLSMQLDEAVPRLIFRLRNNGKEWFIECENPTPLNVSFTSITLMVGHAEKRVEQQPDMMVTPFTKKEYTVADIGYPAAKSRLRFRYLDDSGVQHDQEADVVYQH